MIEHGMYFGNQKIYDIIRANGGEWNDSKERPLVCLIRSVECEEIYWAIPVGNWNHRDKAAQNRIFQYMSYPEKDIRSCFYHLGNTTTQSIFFITDVIPITDNYVEREYINRYTNKIHVIKNQNLLSELKRKLNRILSWENSQNNYYRQRITDIKNYLLKEIKEK